MALISQSCSTAVAWLSPRQVEATMKYQVQHLQGLLEKRTHPSHCLRWHYYTIRQHFMITDNVSGMEFCGENLLIRFIIRKQEEHGEDVDKSKILQMLEFLHKDRNS
eukprot:g46053.t1